jgi:peptidoglycan/LPS O-acetylase OafA/YrhL
LTAKSTYAFILRPLVLQDVPVLPGVFEHNAVKAVGNVSLWTIRFEIFCYAAVVILGSLKLFERPHIIMTIFVIVFASDCITFSVFVPFFGNLRPFFHLATYFLAGMVFYFYHHKIPYSLALVGVCLAAIVAARNAYLFAVLPLALTYTIFYFAFSPSISLRKFASKGDFSYGLYLYAFPIEQLIAQYSRGTIDPVPLLLISTVVTLGIAFLSWHLVENPLMKRNHHKLRLKVVVTPVET